MLQQIYADRKILARALGQQIASLSVFVEDDTSKVLPQSLSLIISIRVLGVQIGSATVEPLANGNVDLPLIAQIGGSVKGRVDDFRALDANANIVANWATAIAIGFKLTAIADVSIPATAIASAIPVIGPLAKAALSLLGSKVNVSLGHDDAIAHLPRSA